MALAGRQVTRCAIRSRSCSRTCEVLRVEVLSVTSDPLGAERFILFYKPYLVRLGIDVSVRSGTHDIQEDEPVLRNFDFDIDRSSTAAGPVARQPATRPWSSQAADTPGLAQLRRH